MTTALLLIDIQNDYFEGGANPLSGSRLAAQQARLILEDFRQKGLPVVHIQHLANRPNATFFLPQTAGAAFFEEVQPLTSEKRIVKHYPNSFRETDLLEYLRGLDVDKLVICGMMTHMCVDATVRAAKDFGFDCTVIGDACATKDLEIEGVSVNAADVQTGFLAALSYFYAKVVTAGGFLAQ